MANEQAGKDWLLQVDSDGMGTFVTVGGLRSKSMSLNADGIDVTNHGTAQNRTLLDGAGILSMSVSGSGVHNGDATTLDLIDDNMRTQTLTTFRLADVAAGARTYTASFKITSFERASEFNAEQTYSISLESSGVITQA